MKDKDLLSQAFVKSKDDIKPLWFDDFLSNKSRYYREYFIPKTELKKSLDNGYRLPYPTNKIPQSEKKYWRKICAPVELLKEFQNSIKYVMYSKAPSKFDHGVTGRNRYSAMELHAGAPIIVALDIKSAFPSVSKFMIEFMMKAEGFSEEEIEVYSAAATLHDVLPQGSPCSPSILNLVRKPLDLRIEGYIRKRFLGQTSVYVDNYYVSSQDTNMNDVIPVLKEFAEETGFVMNNDKIYIMRKGSQMGGLGLVIAKSRSGVVTVQPSKKYRDRIRAILHQALSALEGGGKPRDDFDIDVARGMVETTKGSVYHPRFLDQLNKISVLLQSLLVAQMAQPVFEVK